MIKAVIFDFDYTLGDSTNGIFLSINYALDKLGYEEKGLEEIRKTIGFSLKDTFRYLTGIKKESEEKLFSDYFREKADLVMVNNTKLYVGVKEGLENLKLNGYKIGIVTTKFHYRIEQILEKYKVKGLIDLIIGAEDVKVEKPNPEGLLMAVDRLGFTVEEVLYVGDSIVDAKAAKNANVKFIGVLTGVTIREDFEKFSYIEIAANISEVMEDILYE